MSTSPKVTLLEAGDSDSSSGCVLDSQTEQMVPSLLSSVFPLDCEGVDLCSVFRAYFNIPSPKLLE